MRIAFFGGSFDPPHTGHLAIAEAAQQALQLDLVLFAPVALQPLKAAGSSASFDDRVAMTQLAIQGHPAFELSFADAPKPNDPKSKNTPNYTIDTLTKLRSEFAPESDWFLLLGADSFRTLHHWRRAAEIPFAATLIVATRPGEDLTQIAELLPKGIALSNQQSTETTEQNSLLHYSLTGPSREIAQLFILPSLNYDVSATDLRRQIRETAGPHTELLSPEVLAYIHDHRLYEAS